jgi:ferric-dicitrate binding protein FerR (iron transport regulator)
MILRLDSTSLRRRIRWSCLLFLFAASIQWTGAAAPAQSLDARVASVQGAALLRGKQRVFILARGDLLTPGDEIDTRGGGRVVIELTDGSVVIIHPKSRIVISDYRAAPSLREMFRILVGRVRVKVAHSGGKPNPYRVNSPTASILVRGTEFGVAVEPSGDTSVEVYEGLVEVQSLGGPRRRALLTRGQGAPAPSLTEAAETMALTLAAETATLAAAEMTALAAAEMTAPATPASPPTLRPTPMPSAMMLGKESRWRERPWRVALTKMTRSSTT